MRDGAVGGFVKGTAQFLAFPLIASFVFCLLSGVPFTKFWAVVFQGLWLYAGKALSAVSDPHFWSFVQAIFRKIVFMQ